MNNSLILAALRERTKLQPQAVRILWALYPNCTLFSRDIGELIARDQRYVSTQVSNLRAACGGWLSFGDRAERYGAKCGLGPIPISLSDEGRDAIRMVLIDMRAQATAALCNTARA